MTIQFTVIGLNQIGTSIGLALAKEKGRIVRVGNDADMKIARQAEKMGAFDKIQYNLPSSVEKADVVVLSLPVDEIHETLKVIAPDLKDGCVVVDVSPVASASTRWAAELLAPGRHFVTLLPSIHPRYLEDPLVGVDAAHADLFTKCPMLITCPPGSDESAVNLAQDLVTLLGGVPLFSEALEADGLSAGVRVLPQLAAAALVNTLIDQPGWREGRQLAGNSFTWASEPVLRLTEGKKLGQAALLNRDNVVRMLDALIASLRELRQLIVDDNAEGLHERLDHARKGRHAWWDQRMSMSYDQKQQPDMPTTGQSLGQLFGFGSRPKPKSTEEKKK